MTAAEPPDRLAEQARRSREIYDRQIRPALQPEDEDKFVAIDIKTGEYELDEDDYTAVTRLRSRLPAADVWLERVGHPTAYKIRRGR
jgi:hypothetical protein